ncbi:MAG: hypothetical protein ACKPKO_55195, partial [Candidatus Fonsibacter sp.]
MVLEFVFFAIMFPQTVAFAVEDVLKQDLRMLRDTFVAAGISMSFFPVALHPLRGNTHARLADHSAKGRAARLGAGLRVYLCLCQ